MQNLRPLADPLDQNPHLNKIRGQSVFTLKFEKRWTRQHSKVEIKNYSSPAYSVSNVFTTCTSAVDNLRIEEPSVRSPPTPANCTSRQGVEPALFPSNQGWSFQLAWPIWCGRSNALGLLRPGHETPYGFCIGLLDPLTFGMSQVPATRRSPSPAELPANSQHQLPAM